MAPQRVVEKNEVFISDTLYPITRPVQSALSSVYPPKLVIGDTDKDSGQGLSVLAMGDWREGIGLNKMKGAADVARAWWSTSQLRYQGHLVLPPLATTTAASGVSGAFTIGAIEELSDEIYAAFGTSVRKFNNTTDSWGSSLHTLPAAATDAINVRLGGTVYLAFATTGASGGYTYTSNGSDYTDDTKDTKYLVFWDDRLWGIDNAGQLWVALVIGDETDDAQLPLPDGSVTDLFVARDASGEPILYAATKVGLFAHDAANQRFVETELTLPFHDNAGQGTTKWRDSVYMPAGNGIYKYRIGANTAVVTIMGPDRDDGLPSDKRGAITQLVGTHNELLALTNATTAPGRLDNFATGQSPVIDPDVGFSLILAWNEIGWQVLWLGGTSTKAIDYGHVSFAYSAYRLWWAHNERILHMPLQVDIINPNEVSNFTYAASSEHETPWFTAGQSEVDKLILRLLVETDDLSANETVALAYGLDFATSWTSLGTITTDGITTYDFPDSTTPTGTVFRSIRFQVKLARGSTTTLTPDMLSLTMEYRKKLPAKFGHTVEINIREKYKDKTAKQMRANLLTATKSNPLVEFTFRDDDGNTRNIYVDITSATGLEQSGHDETGISRVTLVER
jgi:hypothetical protein